MTWTTERHEAAKARCDVATPGAFVGVRLGNEHGDDMTLDEIVAWFRDVWSKGEPGAPTYALQTNDDNEYTVAIFGNGSTSMANMAFWAEARADLPGALAEITLLQEMLFGIVVGLEPYDARDGEFGYCLVCGADDCGPHRDDCGYRLGLAYCKRTRPEMWEEEA